MAIRTSLLSTRNINLDTDFSKYIETVSEPGVIEGFALANSKIGLGKARVPCERTNGETIYALVQNFNEVSISGNGYVIISISQTIIDDGSLGNEDGTGIATVEVVSELPSKNYLELYEISELGLITDKRNMIKKVGELNTAIKSLQGQINDLDDRVEALETVGAIDHLEEQCFVGELYTMSDTMFKQNTPKLSECTVEDCKVGNTADNTEIHIQRIASGTASNKLKLKVKSVGSPTTTLKVEVRSGVQVTVTEDTEAYWYGDSENILATGSIAYSAITTDWQELEVTLDSAVGGTKGDLLSIVCYQEASGSVVVNADNYYILACDSTQWSEGFSYVSVNGSTRTRSKLMPYCISDGFAQSIFAKVSSDIVTGNFTYTIPYTEQKAYTAPDDTSKVTYDDIKFTNGTPGNVTVRVVGTWWGNSYNDGTTSQGYYKYAESGTETSFVSGDWYNTQKSIDFSGTLLPGEEMVIYYRANKYRYGTWFRHENVSVIVSGNQIVKNVGKKKDKPKDLKTLGQIATCYLFGRIADGSWWDGE